MDVLYGANMADVVMLRWPEAAELLERSRSAGTPRLLLVDEDLSAPEPVDPLESHPTAKTLAVNVLRLRGYLLHALETSSGT